ncbi:hypothetical protein D3C85_923360 [compost metagenome]
MNVLPVVSMEYGCNWTEYCGVYSLYPVAVEVLGGGGTIKSLLFMDPIIVS